MRVVKLVEAAKVVEVAAILSKRSFHMLIGMAFMVCAERCRNASVGLMLAHLVTLGAPIVRFGV